MRQLLPVWLLASSLSLFAGIPLPEHPRPDWERAAWLTLNGERESGFPTGEHTQTIVVPFDWGSPASGVKRKS